MEEKVAITSVQDKLLNVIKFTTNLSVIVAIIFGISEILQNKETERRKIAIEAVAKTRSIDFIKSFTRLKTAYISNKNIEIISDSTYIDDLNYLMNTYDNIAILYKHDIADKNIIKQSIESNLIEFSKIINSIKGYPKAYKENINYLLHNL